MSSTRFSGFLVMSLFGVMGCRATNSGSNLADGPIKPADAKLCSLSLKKRKQGATAQEKEKEAIEALGQKKSLIGLSEDAAKEKAKGLDIAATGTNAELSEMILGKQEDPDVSVPLRKAGTTTNANGEFDAPEGFKEKMISPDQEKAAAEVLAKDISADKLAEVARDAEALPSVKDAELNARLSEAARKGNKGEAADTFGEKAVKSLIMAAPAEVNPNVLGSIVGAGAAAAAAEADPEARASIRTLVYTAAVVGMTSAQAAEVAAGKKPSEIKGCLACTKVAEMGGDDSANFRENAANSVAAVAVEAGLRGTALPEGAAKKYATITGANDADINTLIKSAYETGVEIGKVDYKVVANADSARDVVAKKTVEYNATVKRTFERSSGVNLDRVAEMISRGVKENAEKMGKVGRH